MLKNRRQAQRSYSSKCRRETIRCRWILLLKLRRGFENQSKNRTAGMARRDYFYDPEPPKPNSPSGCGSPVRFARQILVPYPADQMTVWPISPRVNSPQNDDPGILDPI